MLPQMYYDHLTMVGLYNVRYMYDSHITEHHDVVRPTVHVPLFHDDVASRVARVRRVHVDLAFEGRGDVLLLSADHLP